MLKVYYEQTLSRTFEVEISEEQLAVLRGNDLEAAKVRDTIIDTILEIPEECAPKLEFVCGSCMLEDGEELFDV